MRRNFAGLRQFPDGTWAKKPSLMNFLVSKDTGTGKLIKKRKISMQIEPPKPVNPIDVARLITINLATSLGFGSTLGMAAVPHASIQYEGSFFPSSKVLLVEIYKYLLEVLSFYFSLSTIQIMEVFLI